MSAGERRAANERIFRAVNEQIERLNERFEEFSGEQPQFLCECDDATCTEQLTVGLGRVREVHRQPRRFIVKPGHEDLEVERVVERDDGYFVVEKHVGYEPG